MNETINTVRKFILENFLFTDDDAALANDDSFLDKGIIDSTGMLELIAFIGDGFHITMEDDDLVPDNLDSVHKVASFIKRKQGNS